MSILELVRVMGAMGINDWLIFIVMIIALLGAVRGLSIAHWRAQSVRNDFMREVAIDLVRAAQQMYQDFADPELGKKKRQWVIDEAMKQFKIKLTDKEIESAVFLVKNIEQAIQ